MPKSPVSPARRAPAIGAAVLVAAAIAQSATVACDRIVGIPNVTLATAPCAVAADGAARSGPSMVLIDAGGSSYCIDTTEVTIGHYNDYLLGGGPVGDLPPDCADAAARPLVDNDSDPQLPVGKVVWCHAWSYCSWANKRLCGALGDGGPVGGLSPQSTEWGYACVNGTLNLAYPYGENYEPGVCNVDDPDGGPVPVGSTSGCTGMAQPYSQIHDMVGNVWEFVNDIQMGNVAARGGGWSTTLGELNGYGGGCAYSSGFNGVVYAFDQSGIRCCADP
jgi:formylglycine-generating enzyme required for sulfatase activity